MLRFRNRLGPVQAVRWQVSRLWFGDQGVPQDTSRLQEVLRREVRPPVPVPVEESVMNGLIDENGKPIPEDRVQNIRETMRLLMLLTPHERGLLFFGEVAWLCETTHQVGCCEEYAREAAETKLRLMTVP